MRLLGFCALALLYFNLIDALPLSSSEPAQTVSKRAAATTAAKYRSSSPLFSSHFPVQPFIKEKDLLSEKLIVRTPPEVIVLRSREFTFHVLRSADCEAWSLRLILSSLIESAQRDFYSRDLVPNGMLMETSDGIQARSIFRAFSTFTFADLRTLLVELLALLPVVAENSGVIVPGFDVNIYPLSRNNRGRTPGTSEGALTGTFSLGLS